MRQELTRELAQFAVRARFSDLPESVRAEAVRAFLNWFGCVLGGCREPAVEIAVAVAAEAGGRPQARVFGHDLRTDLASAALLNCFSSSVLAFDDTHLATVTHPTGPVAASLLAFSETARISGEDFLAALVVGMEIECRLSNLLLLPPAQANLSLYITGLTGPIGAAAALGRLLRLDEQQMIWAIGLAATQACGFRGTHGSMAGLWVPALGARSGVNAALLAAKGFTCSDRILEGDKGFVDIFSCHADLDRAADGLGEEFEMMSNAYKPYPCGIVIHAAIDACLDVAAQMAPGDHIENVMITVHPLTLMLTDRPAPVTTLEAMISLYHWAAAALVRRRAGIAEAQMACVGDAEVVALRGRISAVGDEQLRREEAIAEVRLAGGAVLRAHVPCARGSAQRPMSDDDLDAKFRGQATRVLSPERAEVLLGWCRGIANSMDVGKEARIFFSEEKKQKTFY
jgi:2-methylcitrate dehydratase PrpD